MAARNIGGKNNINNKKRARRKSARAAHQLGDLRFTLKIYSPSGETRACPTGSSKRQLLLHGGGIWAGKRFQELLVWGFVVVFCLFGVFLWWSFAVPNLLGTSAGLAIPAPAAPSHLGKWSVGLGMVRECGQGFISGWSWRRCCSRSQGEDWLLCRSPGTSPWKELQRLLKYLSSS